jgi:hypothetical protein
MDLSIAAGGRIVVDGLTPQPVEFGRLRMVDLADLTAGIPGDTRFISVYELARYAESLTGSDRVLLAARRRIDAKADESWVESLGSILQRARIAQVVMAQSLTTGEDEVLKAEAENSGGGGKSGGGKP